MLTPELLKDIAPRARPEYVKALTSDAGWKTLERYEITDSEQSLAGFLANAMHETGGLTILRESLNYKSPKRLRQVWPSRFGSKSDAELARLCNNEKALSSVVYNGRMGNRPGTDDGYNFRGAGYLQTTGRDSFIRYGRLVGIDFSTDPPPSTDDAAALLTMSAAEWHRGKCNELCENDNFSGACAVINVGSAAKVSAVVGMDDRRMWNRRITAEFDKYENILEPPFPRPPVVPPHQPAPVPGAQSPSAQTPSSPTSGTQTSGTPTSVPAQPVPPAASAPASAPAPAVPAPVMPSASPSPQVAQAPAPAASPPAATPQPAPNPTAPPAQPRPPQPEIVGAEAPIFNEETYGTRGLGPRPTLRRKPETATTRSRTTPSVGPVASAPAQDTRPWYQRWFGAKPAATRAAQTSRDAGVPAALRSPKFADPTDDDGDPAYRHRTDADEVG